MKPVRFTGGKWANNGPSRNKVGTKSISWEAIREEYRQAVEASPGLIPIPNGPFRDPTEGTLFPGFFGGGCANEDQVAEGS